MTEDEQQEELDFDAQVELDNLEALGPRGLAFGVLLVSPLFVLYEWSLLEGAHERAIAERLTTHLFTLAGAAQVWLRIGVLAVALTWALVRLREAEFDRGRRALFALLESAFFALLLGPTLLLLLRYFPVNMEAYSSLSEPARPSIQGVAYLFGCAGWEELLIRLGLFSVIFYVVSKAVQFLGGPRSLARFLADATALGLTALAFAGLHLDVVARVVGLSGEAYDQNVFLWRTLAGLALGALYRWRGFGVGAWTHAFYNLGFALGASPAVFLVR